ncbi:MAG: hypothetical protein DRH11_09410 [Deltaproteobacteria bacterium]|nr:MAG: hypothetical protein DRH11_09410 [Deltaproteobacteria bacterium]
MENFHRQRKQGEKMQSVQVQDRREKQDMPCIWAQAGVVRRKSCENEYRCKGCRFEKIMRLAVEKNDQIRKAGQKPTGKRGRLVSWEERLRRLPPSQRPCIHYLKRRITFKACTNDYSCANCEFDQYFDDDYSVHAVISPSDLLEVKGFRAPHGYYFHSGHTWARIEEGATVRVGLDEFALRLFGPLDQIQAPLMGKEVKQGKPSISLIRGGKRASALSPVSGVVTSVNGKLREKSSFDEHGAYSEGWIMRVHAPQLRDELKKLMINEETETFLNREVERLFQLIDHVGGPLAADGGHLGTDIYGNMPELGWEKISRLFLRR